MKLILRLTSKALLLASLLAPLSAFALFENCSQFFPNQHIPTSTQIGRDLCFDDFAIYYSPLDKKPIYTAERLNSEQFQSQHPRRSNKFYEEARLPITERALLSDYQGSGYDRGHNVPAGDMNDEKGMAQSFSLANMMPQARLNNQGIWAKKVEEPTRQYVKRAHGDVYVFTGSTGHSGTIGRSMVTVPSHLYKLIYDPATKRAWAFWIENTNEARMSPPISYSELVEKTGIDFHLPLVETNPNAIKPAQIVGGWYPVFFDAYSAKKVNALSALIKAGKVARIQIQYDQNTDLAKRIAAELELESSDVIELTQSSPPASPTIQYERNRVSVIVHQK
jgi:endonuclease G, mitochondrial